MGWEKVQAISMKQWLTIGSIGGLITLGLLGAGSMGNSPILSYSCEALSAATSTDMTLLCAELASSLAARYDVAVHAQAAELGVTHVTLILTAASENRLRGFLKVTQGGVEAPGRELETILMDQIAPEILAHNFIADISRRAPLPVHLPEG
jgi:hypothetical protein